MEEADGQVIGAVHVYELVADGAASVLASGKVVRAEGEGTRVRGRVDELTARMIEVAAQRGQSHDIVCEADPDTVVNDRMKVLVSDPPRLSGLYDIDLIRTTRGKLRLLCSRTTIRDG